MKKKFEFVELNGEGGFFYAARLRPLGLTAYADTKGGAVKKLKKMVCVYVDAHVKREK